MPERATDFLAYAVRPTPASRAARQRLSAPQKAELRRIVDTLAQDPAGFRDRSEPYADGGYVYKHPEPPIEITYQVDRKNRVITLVDFAVRELVGKLVIISYSHEDRDWLNEIKKFLKPLQKRKKIRIWDDTEIEAGDLWRQEIERYLTSAHAAIFLVSQDFINSDFIDNHELPLLLESADKGHVRILWIAVRPSTYKNDLEGLEVHQAVNDPERPLSTLSKPKREKALIEIREKIEELIVMR